MTRKQLQDVIRTLGGHTAVAKALSEEGGSITPQALHQWRRVPAEWVLAFEMLSAPFGHDRHDLRPDIFGKPLDKVA